MTGISKSSMQIILSKCISCLSGETCHQFSRILTLASTWQKFPQQNHNNGQDMGLLLWTGKENLTCHHHTHSCVHPIDPVWISKNPHQPYLMVLVSLDHIYFPALKNLVGNLRTSQKLHQLKSHSTSHLVHTDLPMNFLIVSQIKDRIVRKTELKDFITYTKVEWAAAHYIWLYEIYNFIVFYHFIDEIFAFGELF